MQIKLSPELQAFREEVRAFVRDNLPREIALENARTPNVFSEASSLRWRRILHEKRGWSMPHWPVEYGGTGWSPMQLFIFEDECHRANAPQFPWQGSHMVGPVLYTFGTEEQKMRFLPPILRGEVYWAQGFSEPGAGSDLASIRTTAVRDGDHYVVNGQKIWSSGAHHSDWVFLLVKTDTTCKPQQGISFLLVDLKTPGITVLPIQMLDNQEHLCEVFYDNVRVPIENCAGEEGKGWSYAKFLLDHERTTSSFIFSSKREMDKAKAIAARDNINGVRAIDSPVFRHKLATVEADLLALEWSVLRVLADEETPYNPSAIASTLKLRGSELQQRIANLQYEALGERGLRLFTPDETLQWPEGDPLWPEHIAGTSNAFLYSRAATIYGGTQQIQRSLIAKLAFGL